MTKQTRGVFFLVFALLLLGFIFSQRGQDMWNILTGRSVASKVTSRVVNGTDKYSVNGMPLLKTPLGYVRPYEEIPGIGLPYIPSVRDWGK